ncbi:MAG: hypothetical protein SNJ29_13855 [Rikenellaceae bacterium]
MQSYAQVVVSGVVRDSTNGEPIVGVVVSAANSQNQPIAYSITRSGGDYSLKVDTSDKSIILSFQHLSYEVYDKVIENFSANIDAALQPKSLQIKEVVVSAPTLMQRGDTLTYRLSALKGIADVTLEDAMKNMPGITIEDSGAIKYLGRNIDNFYIEDIDLLGGKYAIATRNIKADLVSSVELIENHQPVKMLQGKEISDNIALNIKLSKEAKTNFVGTYEGSIGTLEEEELLYRLGFTGMLFSEGFQTINTIKYGNVGAESSAETTSLTDEMPSVNSLPISVLGDVSSSSPSLNANRYKSINDGVATMNGMKKISDEVSIRFNAGYSFSESNYSYSAVSNYFLSDDLYQVVSESYSPRNIEHDIYMSMQYKANKDKKYISNNLYASSSIIEGYYPTMNDSNTINQNREAFAYQINNDFSYRKSYGGNTLSFTSKVSYIGTPENYISYISSGDDETEYTQTSEGKSALFNNVLNYSLSLSSSVRLFLPLSADFSYDNIYTSLLGSEEAINDIAGVTVATGAAPRLELVTPNNSLKATLSTFVNYTSLSVLQSEQGSSKLLVKPNLDLSYTISPKSKLRIKAYGGNDIGDITDFLISPIQTNYRTISTMSGILAESIEGTAMVRYEFKLPLSYLFMNADFSYGYSERNLLNSQIIDDSEIVSSYILRENTAKSQTSSLFISKLFKPIETKFNIGAVYAYSDGELSQMNEIMEYESKVYSLEGAIISRPWKWIEFDYNVNIGWNSSIYNDVNNTLRYDSHEGKLSLFPTERLSVFSSIEHVNNEISSSQFKSISLFDMGVKYKFKKAEIGLAINNILNNKNYTYTIFSGLDSYSYDYALRGREIMLSIKIF